MSLAVNPIVIQNNQATFKGKWDKTDNGTPYYKSNSATIAGCVMAVPAALVRLRNLKINTDKDALFAKLEKEKNDVIKKFDFLGEDFIKEYKEGYEKQIKDMDKIVNNLKFQKKMAIPFSIIAVGMTVGCGVLVDYMRNKKAQETADYEKQNGTKKTLMKQDSVAISNKGRAYYESHKGRKWGTLLGVGCGLADSLMAHTKNTAWLNVSNVALFALGGWIMGMIADRNTNKNAKIHS